MIYLRQVLGVIKFRETGSRMVVARVWGVRGMGSCLMGTVLGFQDERVLETCCTKR